MIPNDHKLTVNVSKHEVKLLDKIVRELKRRGSDINSRSSLIRRAIRRALGTRLSKKIKEELYYSLLKEAGVMKLRGKGKLALGDNIAARSFYIRAAILELEAYSLLDDPSEDTTKSFLIECLVLIRYGTGYKHLPNIPSEEKGKVKLYQ